MVSVYLNTINPDRRCKKQNKKTCISSRRVVIPAHRFYSGHLENWPTFCSYSVFLLNVHFKLMKTVLFVFILFQTHSKSFDLERVWKAVVNKMFFMNAKVEVEIPSEVQNAKNVWMKAKQKNIYILNIQLWRRLHFYIISLYAFLLINMKKK